MHRFIGFRQLSTGTRRLFANVNAFSLRTHNCGELRLKNEGEKVELYGWLAFKRMNRFLVLRDPYGSVQITVPDDKSEQFNEKLDQLTYESTLKVTGQVKDRGENRNPKMATGEIEVILDDLEILNVAPDSMKVQTKVQATEKTRIINRHLDLRSARMQSNLRLRSNVVHKMRKAFVEDFGFVEVETPTLAQWTPGGAREFPVPCGKPFQGSFYSLPQSPQIFKQILMCGGIDRYFQMARCYRDEGAKPDRQPEFTQVDFEVSFTTQEHIIDLIERLIISSWPDELADFRPTAPFRRMTHEEVMQKYGTDKPDLRKRSGKKAKPNTMFEFLWVVDFPLFTNNSEGQLESSHHPFTAPAPEHIEDLWEARNLHSLKAQHYDLVMNGVEIGGGSVRIHNAALQRHVLNLLSLPETPLAKFLEALESGAPPHAGFAFGLDRYISLLAGKGDTETTIRDVIAFPKTKDGRCLMMDSPAELPQEILDRYAIKVEKPTDGDNAK